MGWNRQRNRQSSLTFEEYEKLAAPSENNPVEIYQLKDENLFNQIMNEIHAS